MLQLTLLEMAKGLANAEFSSMELTQAHLDAIQRWQPKLNCFTHVCADSALYQANIADKKRAEGNHHPLTGIPIAHKDIFCTKGILTTCGSKMLHNFIAPYDATVVSKCNDAGFVTLGKTNLDEFGMGSSNENSFFGTVKNPWDTTRVPGGSSGGSAAAVAAQLCAAATGTDTGGSIRQPASFCGLTGVKPTYGRVSRYGMIAYASSLDQAGIFARNAADAAHMLNVISGFDEKDSTSMNEPVPQYIDQLEQDLTGTTIGLPKEYFTEQLDHTIAKLIDNAITEYTRMGANVTEISLPHTEFAIPTYYIIAPAEASSNLSRYDGVRYGYRCDAPKDLEDLYTRSRGEGFGCEVQRRIMVGTYVLSAGYYDAYYLKAQKVRRLIREDFQRAFEQVDCIISPVTPTTAFPLGSKTDDPIKMYLSDIFTIAVNLAGLPSIAIPAGFNQQLPVGLQIIGNYFQEGKLLNMAHQYQKNTDWHQKIPTLLQG